MFKSSRAIICSMAMVIAAIFVSSAGALTKTPHVKAGLISENSGIAPGQPFWVGVRLRMDRDWHTYWVNPGDSGGPTKITWQLPLGFVAGPIQWPYPEKISAPPLLSYGYQDEVLLLTKITPPQSLRSNAAVPIRAHVEWLECTADTCVPGESHVGLNLKVSAQPAADPTTAKIFSHWRFRLPLTESEWTVSAAASPEKFALEMKPPAWFTEKLSDIDFFPEFPGLIDHARPQRLSKKKEAYRLEVYRSDISTAVASLKGILVSSGWRGPNSERAIAIDVQLNDGPVTQTEELSSVWIAILFSIVGGFLLNLMPCVLPVLSLKVLGFVQQSGGKPRETRRHGLAFAVGVTVSFWALAAILEVLKASGQQLGWGFQLQSPVFVYALIGLFFLFGLSLMGVFEVGASLIQTGDLLASKSGLGHSFFSGVLATVVATPCTAPFMGPALGFTLSQPTLVSFSIFTGLAVGMASPYTLLSFFPGLLRHIPKPGAWTETFKVLMGFLFMATVVWLLWVLGQQADIHSLTAVTASLVVFGLAAWIYGRWTHPHFPAKTRTLAAAAAAVLILSAAVGAILTLDTSAVSKTSTARAGGPGIEWQEYTAERVVELRAKGTPVFIDFTAAWCLTCQVNERVAFRSEIVIRKFQDLGIVPLKADWTNRNESIAQALQSYGRSGVPLYVLYGRGTEAPPKILPGILTPQIVLDALDEVK